MMIRIPWPKIVTEMASDRGLTQCYHGFVRYVEPRIVVPGRVKFLEMQMTGGPPALVCIQL